MGAGDAALAGRFSLLGELGRGGMAVVWHAHDDLLGREVAVKQVLSAYSADAGRRDRMIREARAAARLNHPYAVTVYDAIVEDGEIFIVMEYVRGRSLHEVVADDGPLTPARTAALGLAMLDVLGAAHALGVVHRDVKPANVLVQNGEKFKLADFGIARLEGDPTLTAEGSMIGSPAYMAPEQIRGHVATPATDLWALGATLYYAVEGVPAFNAPTPTAAIAAVLTDPPTAPRNASPPLREALFHLLAKDPRSRPPLAWIRERLESAAAQTPAPVPAPPPPPPTAPPDSWTDPARRPAALPVDPWQGSPASPVPPRAAWTPGGAATAPPTVRGTDPGAAPWGTPQGLPVRPSDPQPAVVGSPSGFVATVSRAGLAVRWFRSFLWALVMPPMATLAALLITGALGMHDAVGPILLGGIVVWLVSLATSIGGLIAGLIRPWRFEIGPGGLAYAHGLHWSRLEWSEIVAVEIAERGNLRKRRILMVRAVGVYPDPLPKQRLAKTKGEPPWRDKDGWIGLCPVDGLGGGRDGERSRRLESALAHFAGPRWRSAL